MLKRERARLLIAHSPVGDLERGTARRLLQRLLDAYLDHTTICALEDPGLARLFHRTIVLSRVTTDGPPTGQDAAPCHAAVG